MKIPNNEFFLDSAKLSKAVNLKNMIKVPVVFVAEMVKFYSELDNQYILMPYSQIKEAIDWHNNNMPKVPITENHVRMLSKDNEILPVKDSDVIGYISQMEAVDSKKHGKAMAYFTKSKLHPQIVDALLRGHTLGVSIGGFNKSFGPGGFLDGQKYHSSQQGIRFHHNALITIGLPRCPTNMCGFNFKDSASPWEIYQDKLEQKFGSKAKAEQLIKNIKTEFSNAFEYIKLEIKDSASTLEAAVSERINQLYENAKSKKQKIDKDQIIDQAYNECRGSLEFDISLEQPDENFKKFYDQLVDSSVISSESCILNFWDAYRGTIPWLEYDVINKEFSQVTDNLNLKKINEVKKKMSDENLKKLMAENEALKAENETYKNSRFVDAENLNKELQVENQELQAANKEFADANEALNQELLGYKSAEIREMQKVIFDSGRYTEAEINAMDYPTLKTTHGIVKRFSDGNSGVRRPAPKNQYSTLPRPTPTMDAGLNQPAKLPPRQYKLGSPPPMEVILNAEDPHWKTRFPKGGN